MKGVNLRLIKGLAVSRYQLACASHLNAGAVVVAVAVGGGCVADDDVAVVAAADDGS